mmetsp:Transcript_45235/g.105525  ORF Transcript_45235/g.105525 Transcript_45235/m.105525 type:complete len:166 (-) Transcript_45235:1734-2231(-)
MLATSLTSAARYARQPLSAKLPYLYARTSADYLQESSGRPFGFFMGLPKQSINPVFPELVSSVGPGVPSTPVGGQASTGCTGRPTTTDVPLSASDAPRTGICSTLLLFRNNATSNPAPSPSISRNIDSTTKANISVVVDACFSTSRSFALVLRCWTDSRWRLCLV